MSLIKVKPWTAQSYYNDLNREEKRRFLRYCITMLDTFATAPYFYPANCPEVFPGVPRGYVMP